MSHLFVRQLSALRLTSAPPVTVKTGLTVACSCACSSCAAGLLLRSASQPTSSHLRQAAHTMPSEQDSACHHACQAVLFAAADAQANQLFSNLDANQACPCPPLLLARSCSGSRYLWRGHTCAVDSLADRNFSARESGSAGRSATAPTPEHTPLCPPTNSCCRLHSASPTFGLYPVWILHIPPQPVRPHQALQCFDVAGRAHVAHPEVSAG